MFPKTWYHIYLVQQRSDIIKISVYFYIWKLSTFLILYKSVNYTELHLLVIILLRCSITIVLKYERLITSSMDKISSLGGTKWPTVANVFETVKIRIFWTVVKMKVYFQILFLVSISKIVLWIGVTCKEEKHPLRKKPFKKIQRVIKHIILKWLRYFRSKRMIS